MSKIRRFTRRSDWRAFEVFRLRRRAEENLLLLEKELSFWEREFPEAEAEALEFTARKIEDIRAEIKAARQRLDSF